MKSVVQILKSKADQSVHSIDPMTSVRDAASLMERKDIGALLVVEAERVVGIVTERDIARKMAQSGRSFERTAAREIMHAPVQCVHQHHTNQECMALMTEKRFRHLPVLDETGNVVGMISIGDMVKETISNQKFLIEQLERYIAG